MHIVIDGRHIQDHFPGIGRYCYNLVRALGRLPGNERLTVLHNPTAPNTRYDIASLSVPGRVDLAPCSVPTFSIREQTHLAVLLRELMAQGYHSAHYVMPYRLPCAGLFTFHDAIGRVYPSALPWGASRLLYRVTTWLAVRAATRIIVPSQATRTDLLRLYGAPVSRVVVVPYAADPRFAPQPRERVAAAGERYGLPARYVLYVGINKPHKNLAGLVEAWGRADAGARAGCALVIAGPEDPRYPEARLKAESPGLKDSVRFLGDVPEADLPALYSGATLFAFPSLYEGFGLPVLEAMACGVPVLSSSASSLPEVAGDAAVLLPPADVPAWAEAIQSLLNDRARLDAMRQASLAQAARFSWERAATQTMQVYRDATGGPR